MWFDVMMAAALCILVPNNRSKITAYCATQLTLPNWLNLILGAAIYLTTYIIAATLTGAINKTDTKPQRNVQTTRTTRTHPNHTTKTNRTPNHQIPKKLKPIYAPNSKQQPKSLFVEKENENVSSGLLKRKSCLELLWKMENLSVKKRLGLEVDKQQSYGFSFNF